LLKKTDVKKSPPSWEANIKMNLSEIRQNDTDQIYMFHDTDQWVALVKITEGSESIICGQFIFAITSREA
jgi:ribosomal protein S12 methylthiotransferase accessory factor YcaO